jgi:N-acetylglucosamine-6-phosphate deacetylase
MAEKIRRLVEFRNADPLVAEVIPGFHIEGPFINPQNGYRGAHPQSAIRSASPDDAKRLLEAGDGRVRLFTLAPEQDSSLRATRQLVDQGVAVSAGHTDATLDQLRAAIDAGLTHFTHLGNGCPLVMPRHDNIIQRVLSLADRLMIGFIADGVHVPMHALGNYLKITGPAHAYITTDAMAGAGLGPGIFTLGAHTVEVGEDGAAWASDRSHMVGSAVTLRKSLENLRSLRCFPTEGLHQMTFSNVSSLFF